MNNKEVARLLRNVAASYRIKDEKKYYFQLIAYENASDTIESLPEQLENLYKENKLDKSNFYLWMKRLNPDADQSFVLSEARSNERVAKFLAGKEVKREVYVKGKIVNFVVA